MRFYLLVILVSISNSLLSQSTQVTDKSMTWLGIGVSKKIDRHVTVSYFQTHSYKTDENVRSNFIQGSFKVTYQNNGYKLYVGSKPTYLPNTSSDQKMYHRFIAGIGHRLRFSKNLRGSLSFNFEHHCDQGSKFQRRYYPQLYIYYKNKKLPFRIRPFLSQKLFYYEGGRKLQYYDDEGNKTISTSPNGLHAYRIRMGLNFRPVKRITLSTFFERQREFNTNLFFSKDIHSYNPNTKKTRRKFNYYSTIGASCIVKL